MMDTSHFAQQREDRLSKVRRWTRVGLLIAALAVATACSAPTPEEGATAGDGSAREGASHLTPAAPAPAEPVIAAPVIETPENALALELPEPREVEQVETREAGSKRRARFDDASDDDRPRRSRRERRSRDGRKSERSRAARDSSGGAVSLLQATLAEDVVDRRPKNKGNAFGAEVDRVWAWVKVRNDGAPTHITMVWKHEGREVHRSDLKVGSSRGWRTWTRKKIGSKRGAWSVEIRDARGKRLRTLDFTVRGGSASRAPEPKTSAPKSVASAARAAAPPRTLD